MKKSAKRAFTSGATEKKFLISESSHSSKCILQTHSNREMFGRRPYLS